jgi:lipoprotein-releasing system permease protein
MRFEYFIAWRYLRSRRTHSFVTIITGIAVLAITIGIAALVFALALMHGFRAEIQNKLLQGTAHLNILKANGSEIENYAELAQQIAKTPGVIAAAATTYTPTILGIGERNEQAILKGVDLSASESANEVFTTTIQGDPHRLGILPNADSETLTGIILGQELARSLNTKIGDIITANALGTRLTPLGLQPRARTADFQVVGLFASGLYEYDSKWAYVSLAALQSLTGSGQTAGAIQLKLQDIYAVETIAAQVLQNLKPITHENYATHSWQELNRPLFSALQLQERVVITFFSLLIVIAALNIVSSLTMLVLEKRHDIAILRAQGTSPKAISRIFRWQGLAIGIIGNLGGIPLGLGSVYFANAKRLIALPSEIYSISHIHLVPHSYDFLGIVLFTLVISFCATLYPVYAATKASPVAILRKV